MERYDPPGGDAVDLEAFHQVGVDAAQARHMIAVDQA